MIWTEHVTQMFWASFVSVYWQLTWAGFHLTRNPANFNHAKRPRQAWQALKRKHNFFKDVTIRLVFIEWDIKIHETSGLLKSKHKMDTPKLNFRPSMTQYYKVPFFSLATAHGASFTYCITYVKQSLMVAVSVHSHKGLKILLDQNQTACATGWHIQE